METQVGNKSWYCLQVVANREKSFRLELQNRLENNEELAEKFGEILSPTEQVVEIKGGKKHQVQRKFYPNYVFIEMEMTPDTWNLIKRLPMTRGFIGHFSAGSNEWREPQPISDNDIAKIRAQIAEGAEKPKPKVMFEEGESVRIKGGPFDNFNGNVIDVNYEKSRISVSVSVFGRPTALQLDFEQVEKM